MKNLTALIAAGMMMLSAAPAFANCHLSSTDRSAPTAAKGPSQIAAQSTTSTTQTQSSTK